MVVTPFLSIVSFSDRIATGVLSIFDNYGSVGYNLCITYFSVTLKLSVIKLAFSIRLLLLHIDTSLRQYLMMSVWRLVCTLLENVW